jgi:murein DD-endopeptidase MepM/ murein hydrolase activator NlpD
MIAAVEETFDVRKLRAGFQLTLTRSEAGTLESMEYVIDPDHKLQLSHSNGIFRAAIVDVPGIIQVVPVRGTIEGSLFESIERSGERPELALQIAEIFAWDLDFYTDPREGDQFALLVEKKEYSNGQPSTYKRILAAWYNNAGDLYDAYLFPDKDGRPQYYSRDGRSLRAAFLRSPLKFSARVSSRFSYRRFHPILKIRRPHLGTDYAAPTGTPVQAVAAGRVIFSGRSGGSGNLIRIKHANGFETQYLHLSRRFVRKGQRVEQGRRVGSVGATGLATGSHLDFRLRKNGRYLNFERLKPPRASKISAQQKETFAAARDRFVALMASGSLSGRAVMASGTTSATPSVP